MESQHIPWFVRAPAGLSEFLESNSKLLVVCTLDFSITLKKLKDTLSNTEVHEIDTKSLIQGSSLPGVSILCNNCDLKELRTVIANITVDYNKLVILVEDKLSNLKRAGFPAPLEDIIKWNDLTESFQLELLQRTIIFNDISTTLASVTGGTASSSIYSQLSAQLLIDIINDQGPPILNTRIPPQTNAYLPRQLRPRDRLKAKAASKLFRSCFDTFVVSGIETNQLANFLPSGSSKVDTSSNQMKLEHLSSQFIVLSVSSHFEALCEKATTPVHWLAFEEFEGDQGPFQWVTSCGPLTSILGVATSAKQGISEDDFIERCLPFDKTERKLPPVLISDGPGAGKSVVFQTLGKKLKAKCPERVILFVPIKEYISSVKSTSEHVLEALVDTVCPTDFEKEVLKHHLKSEGGKVELFFDSLEVVDSRDVRLALNCLKVLSALWSVRVWVTTRPHLASQVEDTLQVLSYSLTELQSYEQVNLLVHHWLRRIGEGEPNLVIKRLEEFSRACLQSISKSKEDESTSIICQPLLCQMLAEVYERFAVQYATSTPDHLLPIIQPSSVRNLYSQFVAKKVESDKASNLETEAVQYLFPDEFISPSEGTLSEFREPEGSASCHRSIAEFLVANFGVTVLTAEDQDAEFGPLVWTTFLRTVSQPQRPLIDGVMVTISSTEFEHSVISSFINSILGSSSLQVPTPLKVNPVTVNNVTSACVSLGHLHTLRYILEGYSSKITCTEELLFCAVLQSSLPIVELISNLHSSQSGKPLTSIHREGVSLLHVGIWRGHHSIVEYLVRHHNFQELIREHDPGFTRVLHTCVTNSIDNSPKIVTEKIKILRLLTSINCSLLEEPASSKETPLLCHGVHLDILLELVSLGANLLAVDDFGNTVLHTTATYLSGPSVDFVPGINYDKLMHHLPHKMMRILVKKRNHKGRTPLMEVLSRFEPVMPSLLSNFVYFDTDLNAVDQEGKSVIAIALQNGRSVQCVETLIAGGASMATFVHQTERYSSLRAKPEVVTKSEILPTEPLASAVADIEDVPKHQKTFGGALHSAVQKSNLAKVIQLLESGADVNCTDSEQNTPLHLACSIPDSYEVILALVEHGGDVNALNGNGFTPLDQVLHDCPDSIGLKSIQLLETLGAFTSSELATLVLKRILTGVTDDISSDACDKLIEVCELLNANLGYQDGDGNTLLHLAVQKRRPRGVSYLTEKGVDFLKVNKANKVALDYMECLSSEGSSQYEFDCQCGALQRQDCTVVSEILLHEIEMNGALQVKRNCCVM